MGAGSWLLQFGRCCLPEQRAVEGTQEDRAPGPGARPPPCPPPRRRRRTAGPSGPGLAQWGQCTPTCPWLGAQTGPGRHSGGDSQKRLHGEWGPGAALPSYRQYLVASTGAEEPGPVELVGSSLHPERPLQNLGPPHQEDCAPATSPPLHFCPSLHPCHRSRLEKCLFPGRAGQGGWNSQEPKVTAPYSEAGRGGVGEDTPRPRSGHCWALAIWNQQTPPPPPSAASLLAPFLSGPGL